MKRIKQNNNLLKAAQRVFSYAMICVFTVAILMSSTFAVVLDKQHGSNEFFGKNDNVSVILYKFVRDNDGKYTIDPIPGTEFSLYEKTEIGYIKIEDALMTDTEGRIEVDDIRPGEYYFYEESPAAGYTYDLDSLDNDIVEYHFTVEKDRDGRPVVIFAYNRELAGKLTIEKTVINASGGPLLAAQTDFEFVFTVQFSDNGTYQYKIDGGALQDLISGETLVLKHGESAVFEDIPIGVVYTVTENDYSSLGYFTISVNDNQAITKDDIVASFINVFSLTKDNEGMLTINKTIMGLSATDIITRADEFAFTATLAGLTDGEILVLINGVAQLLPIVDEKINFVLKHNDEIIILNIPYGTNYIVTENDYSLTGFVTLPIGNQYIGTIDLDNTVLPFINSYRTTEDGFGSLIIDKTVSGVGFDPTFKFSFSVTFNNLPSDPVDILIDGVITELSTTSNYFTFELADGESIVFENIPADVTYTVTETPVVGYATSLVIGGTTIAINEISGLIIADYISEINYHNERRQENIIDITVIKSISGMYPAFDSDLEFKFTLEVDGQATINFTLKDGESKTFNVLEGKDYVITEYDLPSEYSLVSYTNESGTTESGIIAVFINRYDGSLEIEIQGEKTWDSDHTKPSSITVVLKNGDDVVQTAVVTADSDGKWKYSYIADRFDDDGNEITYTIEEQPIIGWSPEYDGYDIHNTYIATEVVIISGQKFWDHGSNPVSKRPTSVTIIILADGKEYTSIVVDASTDWKYAIEVPKYDLDDNLITYTVDEKFIANYIKEINGFNITNRFVDQGEPNTGDVISVLPLVILMKLCLCVIYIEKRKRNLS